MYEFLIFIVVYYYFYHYSHKDKPLISMLKKNIVVGDKLGRWSFASTMEHHYLGIMFSHLLFWQWVTNNCVINQNQSAISLMIMHTSFNHKQKNFSAWHQVSLKLHKNTKHHTNLQNTAHKSVIPERKTFLLPALRQLLQLIKLDSSIHLTSLGLTCKNGLTQNFY